MKTINVSSAPLNPNPHSVDARKLYDTQHAQAMHLELKPGQALLKHITPVDVFFYVLEGKGIVEVGDEKQEVGPDTLIESPSGIAHCWYNQSDGVLRVLVVKTPRPTEATKMV
ncbi:MAG: cupin domain-containing protein [Chloroflexi bacterium]|jgi:quercetin dioxygenase-like cupin family protein|nr:cupin domain-containing protein [Chloroflexota bacterium]MBT7081256.1 cupin domain-containing protein [Chloroflexota bacterium]MBT7288909.1 cupin domain-containing protein [Chloroflexota bacterium]